MSTLTVTTIQTNLHWEEKSANLRMLEEKIAAIEERTELVVLPEMFSTGFSMKPSELAEDMEGETMAWMKRVSRENGIVLTGSFIATENAGYYNRLVWMLPNGQYGYYDKRHLFGYAGEDKHYQAGNKRLIASVNGWKINLQVCYDLRFPVWARNRVLDPDQNRAGAPASTTSPEYDLLVYVANWPERRSHAWKTLLCARAIENQCYVIASAQGGKHVNGRETYGDSLIIDPWGVVLNRLSQGPGVVLAEFSRERLEDVRRQFPALHHRVPCEVCER